MTSDFETVDGGVPLPEGMSDIPLVMGLPDEPMTFEPLASLGTLTLPEGFEWRAWDTGIRCSSCGIIFSTIAPTLEMEQRMVDDMAAAHRPRCPGDGA